MGETRESGEQVTATAFDQAQGAHRATPVAPPATRRLTRGAAALARATGVAHPSASLGVSGLGFRLEAAGRVDFAAASALSLTIDARPALIALSEGAHAALAEAVGAPLEAAAKDPEVAALLVEAAFEPLLDRLDRALGVASRVERWSAQPPSAEGWHWSGAALLRDGAALARAAVGFAAADAEFFADWIARAPRLGANDRLIALKARLSLAPLAFARSEIAAFGPGDVVLGAFSLRDMRFAMGGMVWRCGMNDETSFLVDEAPVVDVGAGDPLDGADVEMSFEFARLTVPLAEARSVAPGYVFPLGRRLGSDVDIYVSDRRFGRGRLVEIDGELGVELTRVG